MLLLPSDAAAAAAAAGWHACLLGLLGITAWGSSGPWRPPACDTYFWLIYAGSRPPVHLLRIDAGVFQARMAQFWAWLAARPESVIDVVAHWGVINELTGLDFANCKSRLEAGNCLCGR